MPWRPPAPQCRRSASAHGNGRDRIAPTSIGITAAIAIVAAVAGFAGLPLLQPGERFQGVWDAICTAAGLVQAPPSATQAVRADYPTTRVEIDPQMLQNASSEAIGRG